MLKLIYLSVIVKTNLFLEERILSSKIALILSTIVLFVIIVWVRSLSHDHDVHTVGMSACKHIGLPN